MSNEQGLTIYFAKEGYVVDGTHPSAYMLGWGQVYRAVDVDDLIAIQRAEIKRLKGANEHWHVRVRTLKDEVAALSNHQDAVMKSLGVSPVSSRPLSCYVEDLKAEVGQVRRERDALKIRFDLLGTDFTNNTIYQGQLEGRNADLTRKLAHTQKQEMLQKEVADNQTWHVQDLKVKLAAAQARCTELEEALKGAALRLVELNPNNYDDDDVSEVNNSVISTNAYIREALTKEFT